MKLDENPVDYTCLQLVTEKSKQIFIAAFAPGVVQFWSIAHMFIISMVKVSE